MVDIISVDSIEELRKYPVNLNAKRKIAIATGFWDKFDGGGGTFHWNPDLNSSSDDKGTIISSNQSTLGCWVRIYSGSVNIKWFGAKGNKHDYYKDQIQKYSEELIDFEIKNNAAFKAALEKFDSIFIPKGVYHLSKTLVFTRNNQELYGEGYQKEDEKGGYVNATTQLIFSTANNISIDNNQKAGNKPIPIAITTERKRTEGLNEEGKLLPGFRAINIRKFSIVSLDVLLESINYKAIYDQQGNVIQYDSKTGKPIPFSKFNITNKDQYKQFRYKAVGLEINRGGNCQVEDLVIEGFDVGLQLTDTVLNTISRVIVKECGIAFNMNKINSDNNCNTYYDCYASRCKFGYWIQGRSNSLHSCAVEEISGTFMCSAIKKKELQTNIGYAISEFITTSTYISNMYIEGADVAYFSLPDEKNPIIKSEEGKIPKSTIINGLYFRNPKKYGGYDYERRDFGTVQATTTINGLYISHNKPTNKVGRIAINCNVLLNGVHGGHVFVRGEEVQIGSNCKFASDVEYSDEGRQLREELRNLDRSIEKELQRTGGPNPAIIKILEERSLKKRIGQEQGFVSPDIS